MVCIFSAWNLGYDYHVGDKDVHRLISNAKAPRMKDEIIAITDLAPCAVKISGRQCVLCNQVLAEDSVERYGYRQSR
jgi:hypothetical protein